MDRGTSTFVLAAVVIGMFGCMVLGWFALAG